MFVVAKIMKNVKSPLKRSVKSFLFAADFVSSHHEATIFHPSDV